MENIGDILKEREKYLLQLQKEKERALLRASDGYLRIGKGGKNAQYYYRNNPKDFNGTFIKEKDFKLAQRLVQPIMESEEEFVKRWSTVSYQGRWFEENSTELYTARGERVRSKSEVIIADMLNREGVPYRYEFPVYLKGWGNVYPDFTVLNVRERREIYWEHLGMMDDLGYVEKALEKMNIYAQNGILPGKNLILTYETAKTPLNQKLVQVMIGQYLT